LLAASPAPGRHQFRNRQTWAMLLAGFLGLGALALRRRLPGRRDVLRPKCLALVGAPLAERWTRTFRSGWDSGRMRSAKRKRLSANCDIVGAIHKVRPTSIRDVSFNVSNAQIADIADGVRMPINVNFPNNIERYWSTR
jgi:hypothetical protein